MLRYVTLMILLYTAFQCMSCKKTGAPTIALQSPPTVTADSVVLVVSDSATVSGTVNPEGSATTYHFEYDTTTLYRWKTPEASAGSGSLPVWVSSTIAKLVPVTTYHYRLVAVNAGGLSSAEGQAFVTPPPSLPMRRFIFPLAVGNTWIYTYSGSPFPNRLVWGTHTWKVIGPQTGGSWLLMDIQQDTTKYGEYAPTFSIDSVYFTVVVTADSLIVPFPEWLQLTFRSILIPVSFRSATDTFTVSYREVLGLDWYEETMYSSRIGLLRFEGAVGTMGARQSALLTLSKYYLY